MDSLAARIDHDRMLDRRAQRTQPEFWTSASDRGMVAAPHYLSTAAGAEMLARGGNAFDAAVAASLALAVCEPAGSGLGGMAMMVLHRPGVGTSSLASPCRAPMHAQPEEVAASDRYRGYRAIAVPTHIALLEHVVRHHATLDLPTLMAPAISFARDGIRVTPLLNWAVAFYRRALGASENTGWLFNAEGQPVAIGETVRQPALARTLERLSQAGLQDYYRGEIAKMIDADMRANDGFVTLDDLEAVPELTESRTLEAPYGSGVAHTVGPPGGGMALAQMLHIHDALTKRGIDVDPESPEGALLIARIIRQARHDRRRLSRAVGATDLGDAASLMEPEYNRSVAETLTDPDSGETAHISIMDTEGNAVALTQSVERSFGSAEMSPELGFFYNGYLRAFKVKNKAHPHFLRPGAVARSNAAPTIVIEDGTATASLGCTGSERMASSLFQVLLRLRRQDPFTAVHAPRLHCTPDDLLLCEGERMDQAVMQALSESEYTLDLIDSYAFKMGGLQLIVRQGQQFVGVGEPRRDGSASGP